MIISRHHGFIFIHIPKTGGTSMEVSLARHLAWDDLILGSTELGFAMNSAYQKRYGLFDHANLADVAAVCGPELTNSSFIFAMVRHPLDRIVSLYNFLHTLVEGHCHSIRLDPDLLRLRIQSGEVAGDPDFCAWPETKAYAQTLNFSGFLREVDTTRCITLRPQLSFVSPPPGVKPVDQVIRLEELDQTIPEIAGRLGLPILPGRLNASTRIRLLPRDVTVSDRRRIEELYYEDLVAFDYHLR
jgi:hypothetical protein